MATVAVASPAWAQEVTAETVQANLDIVFLAMASAFVLLMHPGFALLECGFGRSKNAAHIIMKNLMTLCLGLITYFAVGFALMYGTQAAGLVGTDGFFLLGLASYEPVTGGSLSIDFLFQAMFAATAATIVSGACAERMKFGPYLIVVVGMTGLVYPVIGAWKWGGGWLNDLGFLDFAGSTVVHLTGGVAALVAAAILGPRIGKYDASGKPRGRSPATRSRSACSGPCCCSSGGWASTAGPPWARATGSSSPTCWSRQCSPAAPAGPPPPSTRACGTGSTTSG